MILVMNAVLIPNDFHYMGKKYNGGQWEQKLFFKISYFTVCSAEKRVKQVWIDFFRWTITLRFEKINTQTNKCNKKSHSEFKTTHQIIQIMTSFFCIFCCQWLSIKTN